MTLRMTWVLLLCLGVGCAGELDDPQRYRDARAAADATDAGDTTAAQDATTDTADQPDTAADTATADTTPAMDAPVIDEVVCDSIDVSAVELMETRCATDFCHSAQTSAAGLNLEATDVTPRVFAVASNTCEGRTLVDPDNPTDSFLLNILTEEPDCGRPRMPIAGTPFTADEVQCLTTWIETLAAASQGE